LLFDLERSDLPKLSLLFETDSYSFIPYLTPAFEVTVAVRTV